MSVKETNTLKYLHNWKTASTRPKNKLLMIDDNLCTLSHLSKVENQMSSTMHTQFINE